MYPFHTFFSSCTHPTTPTAPDRPFRTVWDVIREPPHPFSKIHPSTTLTAPGRPFGAVWTENQCPLPQPSPLRAAHLGPSRVPQLSVVSLFVRQRANAPAGDVHALAPSHPPPSISNYCRSGPSI